MALVVLYSDTAKERDGDDELREHCLQVGWEGGPDGLQAAPLAAALRAAAPVCSATPAPTHLSIVASS